jgi:galactose mutarotase-like enzyme
MITIKNENIKASFNNVGAELKSLIANGKEYIFGGDKNIWNYSCPLLFPICSGLKDDEYYLDDKKYTLPKHGFARTSDFETEALSQDSVTFLLRSNEETKKNYPFDFELRVIYSLEGKRLKVKYDIKNCGADTMYFSIGAHEAYLCEEGIEEYDVILPQKETLDSSVLEGNLLGDKKVRIIENEDKIALKYDYFSVDALVFKTIKAREVILKNRNTNKALKVDFNGFDYLLLWTKPNAPYICIEPWCGISDSIHTDQNFKTKEGIISVPKGESCQKVHSIEIL